MQNAWGAKMQVSIQQISNYPNFQFCFFILSKTDKRSEFDIFTPAVPSIQFYGALFTFERPFLNELRDDKRSNKRTHQ